MSKTAPMTGKTAAVGIEQALYNLAIECDVPVSRDHGQTLADFAQVVKEAIADKIIELNDCIDEIDDLDLDDEEEHAP